LDDQLDSLEADIIPLIVEGWYNEVIAKQLEISLSTLENTVRRFYNRYDNEISDGINRRCWLVREYMLGRWGGSPENGKCLECIRKARLVITLCSECGEMSAEINSEDRTLQRDQMAQSHEWANDLNQKQVAIKSPRTGEPIEGIAVRAQDVQGGWGTIRVYLSHQPIVTHDTPEGFSVRGELPLQKDPDLEFWFCHLSWKDRSIVEEVDGEH